MFLTTCFHVNIILKPTSAVCQVVRYINPVKPLTQWCRISRMGLFLHKLMNKRQK